VKPSQKIKAVLKFSSQKQEEAINNSRAYIMHLAKLETLDAGKDIIVPKQAATALAGELEIHIPYEGLIDLKAERQRLQKEIGKAENDFLGLERKLSNEEFISKAPKEIVDRENERMLASRAAIAALKEALRKLG
jgi:valyl-tRNA synthetase